MALVVELLGGQQGLERVVRCELQHDPVVVVVFLRLVDVQEGVVQVAVAVGGDEEQLGRQHIGDDRRVENAPELLIVPLAGGVLNLGAPLAGGLGADDVEGPADRIAAEQGALRTSQNFHALEIKVVDDLAGQRSEINPVDHHADRRVDRIVVRTRRADAADRDAGRIGALIDGVDPHVRGEGDDVANIANVRRLELLLNRRDGDGNVLHGLIARSGGDDDFLDPRASPGVGVCSDCAARREGERW